MRIKGILISAFALTFLFQPSFSQEKESVSLSLEDCITKALKNNLSLAVEVYNPEIANATLTRAKETFMPRFDVSFGSDRKENPPYWWIQGAGTIVAKNTEYSAALVQMIPTGGNLSLSLAGYKSDTNEAFQLINPRYGNTMRLDFTQPLLRNFGVKVSRREIIVAQNNADISQDQLKSALIDTIYLVEEAYWNLVYAIENYKVKQQSLQLAKDLLAKNRKEVDVGTLAPIEVLNAEAAVAQREADIIQAEGLIRRGEEVLKNIINMAAEKDAVGKRITPSDMPTFLEKEVSLDKALVDALAQRPDLQVNRKNIETSELNVSVARNQILPGLDLKFSYWSPGISGDRLIYEGDDFFFGKVIGKQKGSPTDSLRDAFKLLYNNWSVGLTLSIPLSSILTKAEYVGAKLELEKSLARLKTLEQQAQLEVSDTVREIETNTKRVHAYRLARELAQKRLEAEEKKLGVGLTTNYFVLQYQEELANARSMELKSLVDYNLSWARLNRVTGTSLQNRNISLSQFLKSSDQ